MKNKNDLYLLETSSNQLIPLTMTDHVPYTQFKSSPKITKKFMSDLEKIVRAAIKSIIGLRHDTPNAMLYTSRKYRGLQIIKPSVKHFPNIIFHM